MVSVRQTSSSTGYVPGLDGLRGIAILLVLLAHTQAMRVHAAGTVGVTAFFTLSGFLITALLLQERAHEGAIGLSHFYARRLRRLAPALLLFLAAMSFMSLFSDSGVMATRRDLLGALFYVGNYTGAMGGRDSVLLHTWSLCVEEQFYVLWPLMIVALARFGRLRALPGLLLFLTALCVGARLWAWDGGLGIMRVNYATELRADGLLVGCLAAIYVQARGPAALGTRWALPAMAALLGMSFFRGPGEYLLATTATPWLTAVVIMAVVGGGARWLSAGWLRLLGRRSYGLYLWHYPLFGLAAAFDGRAAWVAWGGVFVLTAAIVHLSWVCIEEPFLRGRQRVDSRAGRPMGSQRQDSTLTEPLTDAR